MRKTLLWLVVLLLRGAVAAAQTTGAVQGTVTDEQGAAVPSASVVLTRTATNISDTTQTGAEGGFRFDFVSPGAYTLTVSLQGFKTARLAGVLVEAGKSVSLGAVLQVGQATEAVEVTAG